jgi:PKD repeat protein/N-acetylneuraminic acid mutarotase
MHRYQSAFSFLFFLSLFSLRSEAAPQLVCSVADLPDGTSYSRPSTDVEVFAFTLTAQEYAFDIQSMEFSHAGTGNAARQVLTARLYDDANGNGRIDGGEAAIGVSSATPYAEGNLSFQGLSLNIPLAATKSLILAYDFSNYPGVEETFQATLESVEAHLVGYTPQTPPFLDDGESGAGGWTTQGTWALSTEESYSPTHAWSDSPGGNYANNTNASLISPIFDLTYSMPGSLQLSFWHKYETEEGVDFCHVEVSTNGGSDWGEVGSYTGAQGAWVQEQISLASYQSSNFRFRFRIESDLDGPGDGWHLDDIRISGANTFLSGATTGPAIKLEEKVPALEVAVYDLPSPTTYPRGASGAVVLSFGLTAMNYNMTLRSIGLVEEGMGNEAEMVRASNVYQDNNGDSTVDAGDTLLAAAGAYYEDNGFLPSSIMYDWGRRHAPMPTPRGVFTTGVVNGRIYGIGGYNYSGYLGTVEEYDPATNIWTPKAPMPTPREVFAAGFVNGRIYAIGGFNGSYLGTVEEYNPATNKWTSKAPMPTPRDYLAAGVVNGRIYAIGGYNGRYLGPVEEYDPATNAWTSKAPMPTPRYGLAAGVVNGRIYAIGGSNAYGVYLGTVEEYDPATNAWTPKAPMPTPRYGLAAGVVNDRIYAIGRSNAYGSSSSGPVEEYDPAANTWTSKTPMPTPRNGLAAGVVNGRIYAIGGSNAYGVYLGTVEEYDPALNTWTSKATMPTPRFRLAAGVVNGRIYAIGGSSGGEYPETVEEYDPATNTWTSKAPMPTPRDGLVAGVVNGRIYAIGGYNNGGYLGTMEVYDPATNTWTTKAPMPTLRGALAAGVVNGRIYAIGGYGYGGGGWLGAVEVYDPATNTWTSKAPMPTPRFGLAAGVVNGRIYAIGGDSGRGTVEEYDPATNTWTPKAPMPTPRYGLAAGVVNGRIYAIGGDSGRGTVEEYDPATNTWTPKVPMRIPRDGLAAGVVNGRIYAIGGYGGGYPGTQGIVEEFGPTGGIPLTLDLNPSVQARFILTYDIFDKPGTDESFAARVLTGQAALQEFDNVTLEVPYSDTSGGILIGEKRATLNVTQHALPDGTSYPRGWPDSEIMAFTLSAENYTADLAGIVLSSTGTGDEVNNITQAELWLDANASRTIDDGDTLLEQGTFTQDDGTATFAIPDGTDFATLDTIPQGASRDYIISYDFSTTPGLSAFFYSKIFSVTAKVSEYPEYTFDIAGELYGPRIKLQQEILTPTPAPTRTNTLTVTPTFSGTRTPTITATRTPTGTSTSSATPSRSPTPSTSPTRTVTPTITPTNTSSATPSRSPTPSASPTRTVTPTNTPTTQAAALEDDLAPATWSASSGVLYIRWLHVCDEEQFTLSLTGGGGTTVHFVDPLGAPGPDWSPASAPQDTLPVVTNGKIGYWRVEVASSTPKTGNIDVNLHDRVVYAAPPEDRSLFKHFAWLEPCIATTAKGHQAEFSVRVFNGDSMRRTFDLSVEGFVQPQWVSFEPAQLDLIPGEEGKARLTIAVPEGYPVSGSITLPFAVSVSSAGKTRRAGASLIVEPNAIHDFSPACETVFTGRDVTFSWSTTVPSECTLYLRRADQGGYQEYQTPLAATHEVTVENLDRGFDYFLYVTTEDGVRFPSSGECRITIASGIQFVGSPYVFNIARDYNQLQLITVENIDNVSHEFYLTVANPYDDLVIGFIGEGNEEKPVSLLPGETYSVVFAMHAPDAQRRRYDFVAFMHMDNNGAIANAPIGVNVLFPAVLFEMEEIGHDTHTLAKTIRLRNLSSPLTDLSVTASPELRDIMVFQPQISHGYIGQDQEVIFQAIPVLSAFVEEPTRIHSGWIAAAAAGVTKELAVDFSCNPDDSLFTTHARKMIQAHMADWYCTNRRTIQTSFNLPSGVECSDILKADMTVSFQVRTGWNPRPHNVRIYLNNLLIGELLDTVPSGSYEFRIPIEADVCPLIFPAHGAAINTIRLEMERLNGGHYVVATDFQVHIYFREVELTLCAASQSEADTLALSSPYFTDAPDSWDFSSVTLRDSAGGLVSPAGDVQIGLPVTIETELLEQDFDFFVVAGFSNGDPSVRLQRTPSGSYVGTWIPRSFDNLPEVCTVTLASGVCHNGTETIQVTLQPGPTHADFVSYQREGRAPFTVIFQNLSTGTGNLSYLWDFGDGDSSTIPDPQHTYTNPGTYNVSLTTSGAGGDDIETKDDYIVVGEPAYPIIFLPGFMGSDSDVLGKGMDSILGETKWTLFGEGGTNWFVSAFGKRAAHPYEDLEPTLEANQETKGRLKKCPYDWRLPVGQSAQDYLVPCIQSELKRSGLTGVILVCHSMGGLLARSYIQSPQYAGDVKRLIMVGTPNYGSPQTYYPWAGGKLAPGTDAGLRRLLDFWIDAHRRVNADANLEIVRVSSDWEVIHTSFPSVGNLMPFFSNPTEGYLLSSEDSNISNPEGKAIHPYGALDQEYTNPLLASLDASKDLLLSRVPAVSIVGGVEVKTLLYPLVGNESDHSAQVWKDGIPKTDEQGRFLYYSSEDTALCGLVTNIDCDSGDGTVPFNQGLKVDGIVDTVTVEDAQHAYLFQDARILSEVMKRLDVDDPTIIVNGSRQKGEVVEPIVPEYSISFVKNGAGHLLVTDSAGSQVGYNCGSGTVVNEIANAAYVGPGTTEMVLIVNPLSNYYKRSLEECEGKPKAAPVWLSTDYLDSDLILSSTRAMFVEPNSRFSEFFRFDISNPSSPSLKALSPVPWSQEFFFDFALYWKDNDITEENEKFNDVRPSHRDGTIDARDLLLFLGFR